MRVLLIIGTALIGLSTIGEASSPAYLNYQGRIFNEFGEPLNVADVSFTIEILAPAGSCVLYKEFHDGVSFEGKDGMFSLRIGNGNQMGSGFLHPVNLAEILNNNSDALNCLAGGSYDPSPGDVRRLRATFNYNGSGGDVLVSENIIIQSVPYAMYASEASRISGVDSDQLLIEDTSNGGHLTRENLAEIFDATHYPILTDLLDGVSNLYLKPGASGSIDAGGQKIGNLDDPTDAQDAATKNYVDTRVDSSIGGHNVAPGFDELGADEDGRFLVWNGTLNQWEVADINVDITGLLRADGTVPMSGDLDLDGNNITAVNNISAATGTYTGNLSAMTGVFTDSFIGDPAMVGSGLKMRGAIDMAGQDHMGVPTGPHKIINLAAPTNANDAATKAYVDSTLSGRTLTAPGAAQNGQALVWNEATETWQYSALSAGSVTEVATGAGLTGGPITGTGTIAIADGGVNTTQLADGAVSTNKLADGSISTGKLSDGAVTGAKIAANTIATSNIFAPLANETRIVAAGGETGEDLTPLVCTTEGQILKWTVANGWACSTDDAGSGSQWADGDDDSINYMAGNVGIGTIDPQARLEVAGGVRVADDNDACVAAKYGTIRYNGGNLQFCNTTNTWVTLGVSGAGVQSLNGLTAGTQTFAVDTTTGTAPAWNSDTATHTLEIPMASDDGVTAGLLSKADYDAFAAKQDALTYTPVDKAGDAMTGFLSLHADPTDNAHAVNKSYADGLVNTAMTYVNARLASKLIATPDAAQDGQTIVWNNTAEEWQYTDLSAGSVTSIEAGTGLSGGTITDSGTIAIANGGVDTLQLADDAVTGAKIAANTIATSNIFDPVANQTRIVAASGVTGESLTPLTCTIEGQILKWTVANGWACSTDDAGSGSQWADGASDSINYMDGNIGIGTTTPQAELDVNGTLRAGYSSSTTTVVGNYDGTATSINVVSTANFPDKGILAVAKEIMTYSGKTPTSFTGLTRGAFNTGADWPGNGTLVRGVAIIGGTKDGGTEKPGFYIGADGSAVIGRDAKATKVGAVAFHQGGGFGEYTFTIGDGGNWNYSAYSFAGGKSVRTYNGSLAFGFGNDLYVNGNNSIALGNKTRVADGGYNGPDRSMAIGLSNPPSGQFTQVSGTGSLGVFLGDAPGGTELAQNSTMAVMGGKVGIGTTSPGEALTVAGTIESTSGGVKFPDGSIQVSSTGLMGTLKMVGKSNCSWGTTSSSYVTFNSPSGNCNAATVTGGASAPDEGAIPAIKFANLPPGSYEVTVNVPFYSNAPNADCRFRFWDGTTNSGMAWFNLGQSSSYNMTGVFTYDSAQTDKTFYIQGVRAQGTDTCRIYNTEDLLTMEFWVKKI